MFSSTMARLGAASFVLSNRQDEYQRYAWFSTTPSVHLTSQELLERRSDVNSQLDLERQSFLLLCFTVVRLKVEENQLVDVFGEICVRVDGLESA